MTVHCKSTICVLVSVAAIAGCEKQNRGMGEQAQVKHAWTTVSITAPHSAIAASDIWTQYKVTFDYQHNSYCYYVIPIRPSVFSIDSTGTTHLESGTIVL